MGVVAVITDCWSSRRFMQSFALLAEFLVSELQAARIIKYKELHPAEQTTEEDSEKEQRVEEHSRDFCQENEDDGSGGSRREAEMQAEWILLLRALSMDASSQFEDVLNEVSLE